MTHGIDASESFAKLVAQHQSRLWAFVFSIVAEPHLAADVFQETNRVLWEKAAQRPSSTA